MSESKKYYYLKLKEGFFDEKAVKFIRNLPDGDTLLIIYLKMLLMGLKSEVLKFNGVMPTVEEELALALDESPALVASVVNLLEKLGIVERQPDDTLCIKYASEYSGSYGR